ncbi:hypothetical protein N0V83_004668 [Neocucurbitaria cava]|uniref:Uncharacterized protein n=1 Tax=Neocucurbitaria cava TaxID=798079 RepID=A0A9W8YB38_9PLEO|nr:hypothetical protein N0V83_004668 [Neocucurbitaria cava]
MTPRHSGINLLPTPLKTPYHAPFLRAIGLGVVNSLLARLQSRSKAEEPKKSIAKKSFWVALQRCAVHLLPCAVSLIVIVLNLKGYFIGFELAGLPNRTSQYMALLQVAAKAQELLIVASLATVVVHQLRHDLIKGPGVPFGLVGVTSLFSQLSFFWSPTFIGSLTRKSGPSKRLFILILLVGAIAATAGPAVAILVIPRESIWPAGGSKYWVSGTAEDLWPSQVGLEHYMPEAQYGIAKAKCNAANAYTNSLCPSGGYMGLLQRITLAYDKPASSGARDAWYSFVNLLRAGYGTLVTSPPSSGQMTPYMMISAKRGILALESSAVAVHGPSAWIAYELEGNWYDAAMSEPNNPGVQSSRYKYYDTAMTTVSTFVPAVRVVCSPPKPLISGDSKVDFPWTPDFEPAGELENKNDIGSGRLRRLRTLNLEGSSLHNRTFSNFPKVSRVALSDSDLTNSTMGFVFEYPWSNNSGRNVSGCVLDMRWAKGVVLQQRDSVSRPALLDPHTIDRDPYMFNDLFSLNPCSVKSRIEISEELFDAVNFPLAPDLKEVAYDMPTLIRPPNTTAIETLLMTIDWNDDWDDGGYIPVFEQAVAILFADALARANAWRMSPQGPYPQKKPDWKAQILNDGEAFDSPPSNPTTTFSMKQQISGYTYNMDTWADWLSIVVLLIHLVVATGHTILLLVTHRSSSCWDSLPELISLAQQSTPSTVALRNTAAGIYRLSTFRHIARIRVSEEDAEHVELVFDVDHGKDSGRQPDAGQKYG